MFPMTPGNSSFLPFAGRNCSVLQSSSLPPPASLHLRESDRPIRPRFVFAGLGPVTAVFASALCKGRTARGGIFSVKKPPWMLTH